MPTSTGAASDAWIESIDQQSPVEPGRGWATVTDSADWRSVNTLNHCRNTRSTCGSIFLGGRLPAFATWTQDGLIGLAGDGRAHWNTPLGSDTIATSVVPPSAPPAMSTRQLPSFATVATTLRAGRPGASNL